MKKYFLIASLALLACLTARAESGVFASLEGGYASINGLPSQSDVSAISVQNNDIGGRVALGYNHDFSNPHFGFGFESGLGKYGDTVYTYAGGGTSTVKSTKAEFLFVGAYHAIPKLDFFIQAGAALDCGRVYGVNSSSTVAMIQPEVAITAAYNFNRNIAATVTYGRIFGTESETISAIGKTDITMALLGLRYTFAV